MGDVYNRLNQARVVFICCRKRKISRLWFSFSTWSPRSRLLNSLPRLKCGFKHNKTITHFFYYCLIANIGRSLRSPHYFNDQKQLVVYYVSGNMPLAYCHG